MGMLYFVRQDVGMDTALIVGALLLVLQVIV
jgi:hypothetical protein